ncbi:MAG: discoidin domain-containing protein, partial [Planctomycetota bacterium]
KTSNYGGANQLWFEVEDFDERDPPTDQYYSVVDEPGAFGKAINRAGGRGGMIRWTFDISKAGGSGGTWYFWGRVINPSNQSDFMIVEGDPGDPPLPAGPPYPRPGEAEGFTNAQRAFDENAGPPWTWSGRNGAEAHTKTLQDGENTMYIVPRQGDATTFWDVFMWTDDPDYVPTDKNYQNATIFVAGPASEPSPADGATDVSREVVLSWTPGDFAAPVNGHKVYFSESFEDVNAGIGGIGHKVYFSESFEDVNAGIGGIAQSDTSYTPAQRLNLDTTYYWRVDEVNGPPDNTVFEGSLWSFTTEPFAYAIGNITATASSSDVDKGPENTINGSGLDDSDLLHGKDAEGNMWLSSPTGPQPTWIEFQFDKVYKLHEMWVWNSNQSLEPVLGLGCKDVSIEYSVDGNDYTTLGTTVEFARAPGTPDYAHNTTVDLSGVAAQYVRLTANSNWGGLLPQFGLSEVRIFYIPVHAREPNPDSGATSVDVDVVLGWRAGREAATHDVYLSTDEQAVIDGNAPVVTTTEASYGPVSLDLSTAYYWKINEVNMAEAPTTLDGDIWNFTTREFLIVDDFESYNDLDPTDPESNRIFNAWIDGYEQPTNGALVGYDVPPFAEQSNVYTGKQSMPFFYDNSSTVRYSEAELTLSPAQDWTKHGITTLSVAFSGDPNNVVEQMYVKVNDSKVVYGGDAGDIKRGWYEQWNIDLASLGANLQNVTKLSIGVGDETSTTPGGSGVVYVDDVRLYRSVPGPPAGIWIEAEAADSITEPMKIYDEPRASGGK